MFRSLQVGTVIICRLSNTPPRPLLCVLSCVTDPKNTFSRKVTSHGGKKTRENMNDISKEDSQINNDKPTPLQLIRHTHAEGIYPYFTRPDRTGQNVMPAVSSQSVPVSRNAHSLENSKLSSHSKRHRSDTAKDRDCGHKHSKIDTVDDTYRSRDKHKKKKNKERKHSSVASSTMNPSGASKSTISSAMDSPHSSDTSSPIIPSSSTMNSAGIDTVGARDVAASGSTDMYMMGYPPQYKVPLIPANRHHHSHYDLSQLQRRWEHTGYGDIERMHPQPGVEFTLMSYNILAQCLLEANSYLYVNCPDPAAITWEYRCGLIIAEILAHHPDVVCLQEVQGDHYDSYIKRKMHAAGYDGHYIQRTGDKHDGCATFVSRDKFKIAKVQPVTYCRVGLLDRDNVGLILRLEPITKSKTQQCSGVIVANTHLLFNPRRGDIKLAQLVVLLAEIDKMRHRAAKDKLRYPVILCGDLNSSPDSEVFKFLVRGYLNYDGLSSMSISDQERPNHRDQILKKTLLPLRLGISDQCQYFKQMHKRGVVIPTPLLDALINSKIIKSKHSSPLQPTSTVNTMNYLDALNSQAAAVLPGAADRLGPDDLPSRTERYGHHHSPTVSTSSGCLWQAQSKPGLNLHTIH